MKKLKNLLKKIILKNRAKKDKPKLEIRKNKI